MCEFFAAFCGETSRVALCSWRVWAWLRSHHVAVLTLLCFAGNCSNHPNAKLCFLLFPIWLGGTFGWKFSEEDDSHLWEEILQKPGAADQVSWQSGEVRWCSAPLYYPFFLWFYVSVLNQFLEYTDIFSYIRLMKQQLLPCSSSKLY